MTDIGRQLGKYRILEQVGSGGMSVVYRGVDTLLDREVAVKVLHPHLSSKSESRLRLAREARAVAKLHHPNILEVYDFSGSDSQEAFIVTEFIQGQTLRQYVETTRLEPPEVAAMVVHRIADALAQAHEAGIIHRDLKPENVMVRQDGVLKLMDFGIAKIIDRDDRMTITGALVGSPAYMSPEVIEGLEAGASADVFSLGALLYFLITAQLPFQAANTTATLRRILDGSYDDPRKWAPNLSDGLAQILSCCLARDPTCRYSDARALRDALGRALEAVGIDVAEGNAGVRDELGSFFADPVGYRTHLNSRMIRHLLPRAEAELAIGKTAEALSLLNHVLAIDPAQATAHRLLRAMSAARRRRRRWGRLAAGVLGLAAAGVGATVWRDGAAQRPASRIEVTGLYPRIQTPLAPKPVVVASPTEVVPAQPPVGSRTRVRPKPPDPRASASSAPIPTPGTVPVTLNVFPFGYVRVDGGPQSEEASAIHPLNLTPGSHRVLVTCDGLCEDETSPIDVSDSGPNQFYLTPRLKPSKVMFDFKPEQAKVTVRGVSKTARESQRVPFEIRSNKPKELRHEIEYEVSYPGFETVRRTIKVNPGESLRVEGSLLVR